MKLIFKKPGEKPTIVARLLCNCLANMACRVLNNQAGWICRQADADSATKSKLSACCCQFLSAVSPLVKLAAGSLLVMTQRGNNLSVIDESRRYVT